MPKGDQHSETLGSAESHANLPVESSVTSRDDSTTTTKLEAQVEAALREVESLLTGHSPKSDESEKSSEASDANAKIDSGGSEANAVSSEPESSPLASPMEAAPPSASVDSGGEHAQVTETEADPRQDEDSITKSLKNLERRIVEAEGARKAAEERVRLSLEWEVKFRTHTAARARRDEELRKRAEEQSAARRSEEEEKLKAEYAVRKRAEQVARQLAEEEIRLRLEVLGLRETALQLARKNAAIEENARAARIAEIESARRSVEEQHKTEMAHLNTEEERLRRAVEQAALRRTEVESARHEAEINLEQLEEEKVQLLAAEAAHQATAEAMRREAEQRNRTEQERLFLQIAELRRSAEEVARRRAEVEAARQRTEEDAERLREVQARVREAEEQRQQREAERLRLEAEVRQRAEAEERLIQVAREEEKRLEEAARLRTQQEEERVTRLEAFRNSMTAAAEARAERERQIAKELENLRAAEGEARRRIEEIEISRRTADEKLGVVTEKLQRVEAEAHARRTEEERIIARLEEERANATLQAQARADEEKRIKEEILLLRELEGEQRRRMEEAMRQRSDAESRLQQVRDQYQAQEASRTRAERHIELLVEGPPEDTEAIPEWHDDPTENLRPLTSTVTSEVALTDVSQAAVGASEPESIPVEASLTIDESAGPRVEPSLLQNFRSHNPDQRAAALSTLAQSGSADAFSLIVSCFDDQSAKVRNAAALALRNLEPARPAEVFTRALEDSPPDRRRKIGSAIADSGLAAGAVADLRGENREDTYNALCLLFTMAKAGEVQPLVQAIEEHGNVDVRMAAVKLLTLSGQSDIAEAAAKRRLEGQRSTAQTA